MIVKAYAKINIALNVVNKRSDGYHNLDMVVVPLELHDSIEINLLPNRYETMITCDDYSIPMNEYNLVSVAVRKMREFYHFEDKFQIHIHKVIPSSAGLGGGSSDAAAVMRAIVYLLKLNAKEEDLIKIAESIGADVPFFLYNRPARVQGIGEQVKMIEVKTKYHCLLVKPFLGCPTKEIFNRYDETKGQSANVEKVIEALREDKLDVIAENRGNDLEEPAFSLLEEIQQLMESLRKDGLECVGMSGSGSTVFALSKDHHLINKAYRYYAKKGYYTELTSIIR